MNSGELVLGSQKLDLSLVISKNSVVSESRLGMARRASRSVLTSRCVYSRWPTPGCSPRGRRPDGGKRTSILAFEQESRLLRHNLYPQSVTGNRPKCNQSGSNGFTADCRWDEMTVSQAVSKSCILVLVLNE